MRVFAFCCQPKVVIWCASVLLAFATMALAANQTTEDFVLQSWTEQYGELQHDINTASTFLPKSMAAHRSSDRDGAVLPSDRTPLDVVLRRTAALIDARKKMPGQADVEAWEHQLIDLRLAQSSAGLSKTNASTDSELFLAARELQRRVALSNPLLPDTLLFVMRGLCAKWRNGVGSTNHMCDQYFGFNACAKGGLYLITGYKSGQTKVIDILEQSRVQNGRLQGRALAGGAFLSPDLSFDGTRITFAWLENPGTVEGWTREQCWHVFRVNRDGTNLVQLTDGPWNEFDPCWLPNGRIVFISERVGSFGRCHPRAVPTYTLHSMKDDGTDLVQISYHETNEWQPSVDNDGMLVYTRWDYLDRDFSAAHHMWHCWPDGRDPRSYHGNYSFPLATLTGTSWRDGRGDRPFAEYNCRAVPNSPKYVAVASGHHTEAYGDLVLIDTRIEDDNKVSQVKRITGKGGFCDCMGSYGTPWPLSEAFYLCNFKNSIVLLDSLGNRDIIYTSADSALRPLDPIPWRPRAVPPILPTQTYQGERHTAQSPKATISVMNVNITDQFGTLPSGVVVKQLRVIQVLPKTTPYWADPMIGPSPENGVSPARMPIGVVPVESDGSVYFEAPVGKGIYFQLLDDKGMAIQSMRSSTYVHSGEQLSCTGCHENKWSAVAPMGPRSAMQRRASKIMPEVTDQYPFGFYRHVKSVFATTCLPCHVKLKQGPQKMDYASIVKGVSDTTTLAFFFVGGASNTVPLHGGSRTMPGNFGAHRSRMGRALLDSVHQQARRDGVISAEDFRRVVLWLDCNSDELNTYKNVAAQKRGDKVWHDTDVDSTNPTATEWLGTTREMRSNLSPIASQSQRLVVTSRERSGALMVRAQVPDARGQMRVAIFDLRGRCLGSQLSASGYEGTYTFTFPQLRQGRYIAKLTSGQQTAVKELLVAR